MNTIKNIIVAPLLKNGCKKNLLTNPKITTLSDRQCIGYSITTSIKGNQKKEDIPPFFHDVYDNGKLDKLWTPFEQNMYCIFNMHKNGQDFDYYIATDNNTNLHDEKYAEITIPAGKYVTVELMKRNHKAVSKVMMYLRAIWVEANGYKEKKSPAFILYDERFHANYRQNGCVNGNYPGNPVATMYLPVTEN